MVGTQAAAVELPYALAGFDERAATAEELLAALADTARAVAWLQAREADLLAELASRPAEFPAPAGVASHAPAAVEAAALLRWSPASAEARMVDALDLTGRLPATLAALRFGRIDAAKARAIVAAVRPLDAEAAAAVEARALRRAEQRTLPQLRAVLRRAVLAFGPATEERAGAAMEQRRVVITPTEDGMAELWALVSAVDAAAIASVLDCAASRTDAEDGRTADQRRADALVELLVGAPGDRPRPQLHLTMPVTALLGLDDAPAELFGVGPIPADLVRDLVHEATWRRILTDPVSGEVLDVGRTRYTPPAGLDRFVRTRDGRCRFPGCRRRAARCDLDHAVRFPDGPTAAGNLFALCRRHHRLKHEANWSAHPDPDGSAGLEWVSPAGQRYRTEPPPPGEESFTRRIPRDPEERHEEWLADEHLRALIAAGSPPAGSPEGPAE